MAITADDGRIVRCNRALVHMLGYPQDALIGMSVGELTHPDDRVDSEDQLRRLFKGEISGYELEKRYLHADGHSVLVALNVSAMLGTDGKTQYSIGHIQDITERKAIDELLTRQAMQDPLTGLPNRGAFLDQLGRTLANARGHSGRLAVLFLDIDHFKVVNDSLGHDAGDQLLITIGERLRRILRPADSVARFGGDEFTVLCRDIRQPTAASKMAERIQEEVAHPVLLPQGEVFVTASIGIALSDRMHTDGGALVRDADAAMYRAKQGGRARVEFSDVNLRSQSLELLHTNAALRRGLERDEFNSPLGRSRASKPCCVGSTPSGG